MEGGWTHDLHFGDVHLVPSGHGLLVVTILLIQWKGYLKSTNYPQHRSPRNPIPSDIAFSPSHQATVNSYLLIMIAASLVDRAPTTTLSHLAVVHLLVISLPLPALFLPPWPLQWLVNLFIVLNIFWLVKAMNCISWWKTCHIWKT